MQTTSDLISLLESKLDELANYNEQITQRYKEISAQYGKLESEYQTLQTQYIELLDIVSRQRQILEDTLKGEYDNLNKNLENLQMENSNFFNNQVSEILKAVSLRLEIS
ncbi:hypothetical protein [Campylobacter sp. 7477a]|uniref:hypothetical protein n=1 Tax=Campylobacter sp. 7477a TaxID=2735741 RepID=UPI003014CBC5|nr:hypothetical protein [Campylobacter sp. 7477a]